MTSHTGVKASNFMNSYCCVWTPPGYGQIDLPLGEEYVNIDGDCIEQGASACQGSEFELTLCFGLNVYSYIPEEPDQASDLLEGLLYC